MEARTAARENRNVESARLFQQAIARDPSHRREWLREWADQLTYSNQAKAAVPLFREVLASGTLSPDDTWRARHGLALALRWSDQKRGALREYDALVARDPKDTSARLGRARALLWLDRHGPARREYEAVLAQDPGNLEARRGLAQVESWRGKQREAQRRLQEFLKEHPDDPDGVSMMAQSQEWMGRPDRAEATLRGFLDRHPNDEPRRQLLDEILLRQRLNYFLDYQRSTQTDDLVIARESFEQNLPLQDGRTTLGARYQRYSYDPAQGQPDIAVNRPGASARHRFSDRRELTGTLYLDLIDPDGDNKSRAIPTYDLYYTLRPSDVLRFDIGSNRSTFDNIRSLLRGVTGTFATVSMDYVPDEKMRVTTRYNWGGYSDGNERNWGQLEYERRVWVQPNVFVGARYTAFGFSDRLDNGYFNPDSYNATVATLHVYNAGLGNKIYYDLDTSYGREHSDPGGGKPFSSLGIRLTYRFSDRMAIEGRYQYFSSRQASSGGFARRTAGIALRFVP